MLIGAVAPVPLIGWADVANLMLTSAGSWHRKLAIRSAVGDSPRASQLLTEIDSGGVTETEPPNLPGLTHEATRLALNDVGARVCARGEQAVNSTLQKLAGAVDGTIVTRSRCHDG